MKIAIVAPPFKGLPPKGHGGIERIVQGLIDVLVKQDHQVIVLGVGKSQTVADFIKVFSQPISQREFKGSSIEQSRPLRIETAYLTKVMKILSDRDGEFDVVFNHARGGYLLLPLFEKLRTPIITTEHLPLFEEVVDALSQFERPNLVSISDSQRKPTAGRVNFLATVYNGTNLEEFPFNSQPKEYFLFLGAIGEHKSPHLAIEACKKAHVPLILAGGRVREPYFSKEVKPHIDGEGIRYIGEVEGKERVDLFRNAKGFLFPITWEEPFGLVMIEAMACGTPVIAFNRGAVPEVVEDGKTGFIVEDVDGMAETIKKIDSIDRKACRALVEEKFTYEKMVDGYLEAFQKVRE